jgi:hypothetical protein
MPAYLWRPEEAMGVRQGSLCSLDKENGILKRFIIRLAHSLWRKKEAVRRGTVAE